MSTMLSRTTVIRRAASALCGLVTLGLSAVAHSGTATLAPDLATFAAGAGGPLMTQDFEGYSIGTNLVGAALLPGITATTNKASLEVFSSSGNKDMFMTGRSGTDSRYDLALGQPYKSVAFDIVAFEAIPGDLSTAQGPGTLTVSFADATSQDFLISGNASGSPIFVGLLADTNITGIRWAEAVEGNELGNEETALDDLRVTTAVPEPASVALFGIGLAAVAVARRLRRRRG